MHPVFSVHAKSCATTRSTATARSAGRGNVTGQCDRTGQSGRTRLERELRGHFQDQPPGRASCRCVCARCARQRVFVASCENAQTGKAPQALNARAGIGPLVALREAEPQSIQTGTRLSQPPPPFALEELPVSPSPSPSPSPGMDGVVAPQPFVHRSIERGKSKTIVRFCFVFRVP